MELSVVVAVWNERENLAPVLAEIEAAVRALPAVERFEIVVVDDGSTDGSSDVLRGLASDVVRPVLIEHRAKTGALHAGFAAARYPVIATLDGDGQDIAAELGPLIARLSAGDDLAIGVRQDRSDTVRKKISSWIGNAARRVFLGDPFTDIGCGLRVFRRDYVAGFATWEGAHRFFPYFAWRDGARVAMVPIRHRARLHGASKYGVLDRLAVGLPTLIRVFAGSFRRGIPPPIARPGVLAGLVIAAFLGVGLVWNGDWGWTRDGLASISRALTNLAIVSAIFRDTPFPKLGWHMNHPALPATAAYAVRGFLRLFAPAAAPTALFNVGIFLWSGAGLIFLYRFVRRAFDAPTALWSVVLMASYPRFMGAAHIYHKDAPLASAALLFLLMALRAAERKSVRNAVLAGAAGGLAISVHLGALGLVPIFFAMQLAAPPAERPARFYGVFLAAGAVAVFALNPILWMNWDALARSARVWSGSFWPYSEMYLGQRYEGGKMPWHYTALHLAAGTPLLDLFLAPIGLWRLRGKRTPGAVGTVLLLALPIVMNSLPSATRYDGLRHVVVSVPALMILAALGLQQLWERTTGRPLRYLLVAAVAAGLLLPVRAARRLHPYEEGYLNEAALRYTGGKPNFFYQFDYDAPLLELVGWVNRNLPVGASVSFDRNMRIDPYPLRRDIVLAPDGTGRFRVARFGMPKGCTPRYQISRYNIVLAGIGECGDAGTPALR